MKKKLFYAVIFVCILSAISYAFDPEIEAVIKKAYQLALKGDPQGVMSCCHTEVAEFKGSFDTGYSPGRSASLGELSNFAAGVQSGEEKLSFTNLKIEVIREEGEKATATVKYHVVHEYKSSLSWQEGKPVKEEWEAEDKSGHFFPLEQQNSNDPYGGVE
jgi:hypothetical protein